MATQSAGFIKEKVVSQTLLGFPIDLQWDYENGFYLTGNPSRLTKILAQYELYKKIANIPGDIIECGVYKASSLIRLATFRDYLEKPLDRKIFCFDLYGREYTDPLELEVGSCIAQGELNKVLTHKGFKNIHLINGDMEKTIPQFVQNNADLEIALLHLDVDQYKPSRAILENFWDCIAKNGIVFLDDYGSVPEQTQATDEFCSKKKIKISKLGSTPSLTYLLKEN
jgi:hypothetical protein